MRQTRHKKPINITKRVILISLSLILGLGVGLGTILPAVDAAAMSARLAAAPPAPASAPAPATAAPAAETPRLVYELRQDPERPYRLHFTVTNPKATPVDLTFPTGQDYDLALYREDSVVWRASDDQMYTQAVRLVRLAAGAVLEYHIDLPAALVRGVYRADALFAASRGAGAAASLWLWLPGPADREQPAPTDPLAQLSYRLAWDTAQRGVVVFTVTNQGTTPVRLTFPTAQQFDIVARQAPGKSGAAAGEVVWRASDGQMFAQSMVEVTLAAGASLSYRAEVPKFPAGTYRLEAYFAADSSGKVAAGLRHQVAGDTFLYGVRVKHGKVNFWLYNGSGKTQQLRFEGAEAYRLVLVDRDGREVWSTVGTRFSGRAHGVEPIKRGMTMNYVTAAPDPAKLGLAPGTYTLEAYFLGTPVEGPHATCEFVVGR